MLFIINNGHHLKKLIHRIFPTLDANSDICILELVTHNPQETIYKYPVSNGEVRMIKGYISRGHSN